MSARPSRTVQVVTLVVGALCALALVGALLPAAAPPGCCASGPALQHPLGTDAMGSDLLLRLLRALGTTGVIVLGSTTAALAFGTLYGAVVATLPPRARELGMRLVDVVAATPMTLLVITLMVAVRGARDQLPSALSPVLDSRFLLVFCVASIQWFSLARVAHARLVALRDTPFITAARIVGTPRATILLHHVAPHLRGPLLVFGLLALPSGVAAEGFFSFLGFGVERPHVSLGVLIADGARMMTFAPLTLFAPAVVLVGATVALQVLAARLRDELRPQASPSTRRARLQSGAALARDPRT